MHRAFDHVDLDNVSNNISNDGFAIMYNFFGGKAGSRPAGKD